MRGYCLTKLEVGDGPNGLDADSVAAGYAPEVGTLTVLGVSPRGDVRPRFTG